MKKSGEVGLISKESDSFSFGLQNRDNRRGLRLMGSSSGGVNKSTAGLKLIGSSQIFLIVGKYGIGEK
jgi:hypothetical protein